MAYADEISKHRMKVTLYDITPKNENCWIAPNATVSKLIMKNPLVGEVLIKMFSTVWYNAVIRGDINRVEYSSFIIIS